LLTSLIIRVNNDGGDGDSFSGFISIKNGVRVVVVVITHPTDSDG
jgi:hypothetical protein